MHEPRQPSLSQLLGSIAERAGSVFARIHGIAGHAPFADPELDVIARDLTLIINEVEDALSHVVEIVGALAGPASQADPR